MGAAVDAPRERVPCGRCDRQAGLTIVNRAYQTSRHTRTDDIDGSAMGDYVSFSTKASSWRRLRHSYAPSVWMAYSPTMESPVSQ